LAKGAGKFALTLDLHQLDTKRTLAQKSGEKVRSLVIPDRYDANADVSSGADVIAPWYAAMTTMAESGRSSLLEVGGALPPLFHSGVTDLDVEEDIGLLGLTIIAMIVTKAGGDAASQLVREVRRWEQNIPSAHLLIALNEMNGSPLSAAEELEGKLRERFFGIVDRYPTVRIPRLHTKSMVLYERMPYLPSEIVSWHRDNYSEALAKTGKPRDEAKRFIRDIATWTGTIQDELLRVMPFLHGEEKANG